MEVKAFFETSTMIISKTFRDQIFFSVSNINVVTENMGSGVFFQPTNLIRSRKAFIKFLVRNLSIFGTENCKYFLISKDFSARKIGRFIQAFDK